MGSDTSSFDSLIEDTYRLFSADPALVINRTSDETLATAHVVVREVAFSVVYFRQKEGQPITVFCDFGSVPEHKELTIYKQLMEMNFHFSDAHSAAFCLNPENGHVLFTLAANLEQLTAPRLHHLFNELATQATYWRSAETSCGPSRFVW
ncbi:hypothetical protein HDC30_002419 [Pseudomonas sp. JAI115]|uniref:CesT family type III secretion system chaperone n=1 Tax=Pseudomonas sp. JAI115 TaxID=2723061 RepID=UPI00160756E3|nr:CesT family type III secretion system chaperone [Pseudomonas sp. JAI115]MBB6155196.1 hypothetical protein [Pseudomonas sp. JAI115]